MDSLLSISTILNYFQNNDSLFKRGENSFTSRNVKEISFDGNLKIIRGKVNASMKQRTYTIEIWLSNKHEIQNAKCDCPRGLEICHHIAATLLASHYEISKTDSDCSWAPKPDDSCEVQTVEEVFLIKKPPRVTDRNLSEIEMRELLEELEKVAPVGMRWILNSRFNNNAVNNEDNNVNDALIDSVDIAHLISSPEFDQACDQVKFDTVPTEHLNRSAKSKLRRSIRSFISVISS